MVVRRNDTSRTKHLSNNRMPSETYLEDEEGAKLLVLTDWLKNNVGALFVQIKKLETTVECIENYVEEKTGVEPGKEISSDSDSSDSDYKYTLCEAPTSSEKNICKVKLTFAVPKVQVMESKRQAERVPEGSSKKEESETRSSPKGASYASSSNNLPSDQEELTKVFEKNLEALENMVKLFRSDVSKMFDISDPNFPGSSINASPEK
ncbi:uncharacterized protein OCT59_006048 [Rhizophagus irregularis]|uniref:uncharacterized protein n=1 Tax=Rhizophagus irregularis TaxID=588596 RepID=UPI00331D774A|nr:hypothetical protein OCT59_006048 [Rhizophagus irregularis]